MTPFLVIGGVGVVLLVISVVIGDVLSGALDVLGGGADWLFGAVAGFLGAFGFVGALVLGLTDRTGLAIAVGLAAGVAIGALAAVLTRYLQRDDQSTPRSAALVGLNGIVVNDIPAQGYGEISVVVSGHLTKLNARCPEPLAAGSPVIIDAVLSPTSVAGVPRMV